LSFFRFRFVSGLGGHPSLNNGKQKLPHPDSAPHPHWAQIIRAIYHTAFSWNPLANPMERDPSGSWTAPSGAAARPSPVFVPVDGEPMLDPSGYGIARDERGKRVSLIAVSQQPVKNSGAGILPAARSFEFTAFQAVQLRRLEACATCLTAR
jgi:hypothetical protein